MKKVEPLEIELEVKKEEYCCEFCWLCDYIIDWLKH